VSAECCVIWRFLPLFGEMDFGNFVVMGKQATLD
jgi:hypothetical protein